MTQEPTQNAASEAPALPEVLCLATRLRKCLRFDEPTSEESELEQAARNAAIELEQMVAYVREIQAWQGEGETLLGKHDAGALFVLGAWWADRPWRNREA